MRKALIFSFLFSLCTCASAQKAAINFAKYLKPRPDTLFYNCVYDSFHASGLHETIALVYRSVRIGNDTAYYISLVADTTGKTAWLSSFIGSAMIFKNDTVWLASLNDGQSASMLTQTDFTRSLSPHVKFAQPFELSKVKWAHFIDSTFIKSYQLEDLAIGALSYRNVLNLT